MENNDSTFKNSFQEYINMFLGELKVSLDFLEDDNMEFKYYYSNFKVPDFQQDNFISIMEKQGSLEIRNNINKKKNFYELQLVALEGILGEKYKRIGFYYKINKEKLIEFLANQEAKNPNQEKSRIKPVLDRNILKIWGYESEIKSGETLILLENIFEDEFYSTEEREFIFKAGFNDGNEEKEKKKVDNIVYRLNTKIYSDTKQDIDKFIIIERPEIKINKKYL